MSARHSIPIRGLMSTGRSPQFEGKFGRMLRQPPPANFGGDEHENMVNLGLLGSAMSADPDPPKDGPDDEESGIPALYTYFGQFIDHDITFDPASSLQRQNDPDALVDYRTPAFDLDNVYGRGPDDQPYMYDGAGRFLLGDALTGGADNAKDLPRNSADPARALIGDPRNDENVIVSQLQGLFLQFHNRYSAEHPALAFEEVQAEVRFRYQYAVVNDFLPRIVHSSVIAALKDNGQYSKSRLHFYHFKNDPFIPVEFSAAVYRLGHSMIRPGYRLNDLTPLLPIFPFGQFALGLTGFRRMVSTWALDWGRFVDIDQRAYEGDDNALRRRLQFAYRIDTSLVNPLAVLPEAIAAHPSSLAQRNLLRGWRLGLPSGQDVANAMGVAPLADGDILIGKDSDPANECRPVAEISPAFAGNCPLWTYILAEARHFRENVTLPVTGAPRVVSTPRLGAVGGRICAEVFLGLLFGDGHSYLNLKSGYVPDGNANYGLRDIVNYAIGH